MLKGEVFFDPGAISVQAVGTAGLEEEAESTEVELRGCEDRSFFSHAKAVKIILAWSCFNWRIHLWDDSNEGGRGVMYT